MRNLGISEKFIHLCYLHGALFFQNEIQNFLGNFLYFSQLFFTVLKSAVPMQSKPDRYREEI